MAKKSVDAQLNGNGQAEPAAKVSTPSQHGNGHGPVGTKGNGSGNNGHRASDKQFNFINQLARSIRGLGTRRLESLTGKMFGKPLADLTGFDASSLIDTLKAIKDGTVSLEAALNNGAPT